MFIYSIYKFFVSVVKCLRRWVSEMKDKKYILIEISQYFIIFNIIYFIWYKWLIPKNILIIIWKSNFFFNFVRMAFYLFCICDVLWLRIMNQVATLIPSKIFIYYNIKTMYGIYRWPNYLKSNTQVFWSNIKHSIDYI